MALSEGELFACYRRLEKPLYNALYRWLWQAQDCQDVIHDAFLRVWHGRARVDAAGIDKLVWTVALNLARNKLRWRKIWRFGALDAEAADDGDPAESAAQRQRETMLRGVLDKMSKEHREVLLLSEFGGLSTAEIADVLNIPAGTVGSRKHNALSQLRRALSENDDD